MKILVVDDQPANLLTDPVVAVRRVGGAAEQAPAAAAIATPVGEGYAEAPPSAGLEIPPTSPQGDRSST